MPIYTGRGDEGETDLHGGTRVSKTDPRIEAYGTVDEVNALLGTVLPSGHDDVDGELRAVQNHLHIVQASLANPDPEPDEDAPSIGEEHVATLEGWIDRHDDDLEPLDRFILPGGSAIGARLHHARAVSRRAERRVIALARGEPIDGTVVVYLNRLSDYLFTAARTVNARDGVPEESPTY